MSCLICRTENKPLAFPLRGVSMPALRCLPIVFLLVAQVSSADNEHVVKLEVSPAARPEPAMRYRLSPTTRELVPGNAAALYYRAVLESQSISDQLTESNIAANESLRDVR